ncbi:hypothetical protein [Variovorax sp. UC74_104]|uniref:hypothetical protein n=1 Tax=Variovorax sp. UC74_104 TaxID=3374555 RepID=UPI003756A943
MPQSLDDLRERVKTINVVFSQLLSDWNTLAEASQEQLTTGINKAYGQAASFQHEYQTAMAGKDKHRPVITQKFADVTIGAADDFFAKSIEAKSLTAPTKGDANLLYKKAIKQIAGETGYMPRANDVRIIDLRIEGTNPWPLPGGAYGKARDQTSLEDIQKLAKEELWKFSGGDTPADGARELMSWLNGETHKPKFLKGGKEIYFAKDLKQFSTSNPNSSRVLIVDEHKKVAHLRCVTIKIRYIEGYPTYKKLKPKESLYLDEIIFQMYKDITDLKAQIRLAKIRYRTSSSDAVFTRDYTYTS